MENKIEIIGIEECISSEYIKPKSMHYMHNGAKKRWDMVDAHNSVAILLYHEDRDAFVFVKQFRPSIYLKNDDGFTYELCAGLVDKEGKSDKVIAYEEILEETGYDVPLDSIKKISSFYTAVGIAGGRQTLYFAKLRESMRINEGGGIDNENIEVVYIDRKDGVDFMFDESVVRTSGLMFALMWYFKVHGEDHR